MSQKSPVPNILDHEGDEENIAKIAAARIAKRDLDEYDAARKENINLSQIPNYQSVKDSIGRELARAERQYILKRGFHLLSRIVACLALASVLTTGVLYVTVDAARNSINNFFLELQDGYAILHGDEELFETEAPLPENWTGPVTPKWVPERFTNVSGSEMRYSSSLVYTTDDASEMVLVTTWSVESSPAVDRENMIFRRTVSVQGVEATLYIKDETRQLYLDFVKNNYVVQVCGNLTEQEIIKIAENIQIL